MDIYPLMDIRVPEKHEAALVQKMKARVAPPWKWQEHDAFGRPAQDGSIYFHRNRQDREPPCTLCIRRENPGHLVVCALVPDEGVSPNRITLDQHVKILQEFEEQIASPAAEELGGITQMGTSSHTLEDHFSPEAVKLLKSFCASNAGDGGRHPNDQGRWIAFLLHVHRHNEDVHCDTFGACLRATGWWLESGVPELVREYDFAMQLLDLADKTSE